MLLRCSASFSWRWCPTAQPQNFPQNGRVRWTSNNSTKKKTFRAKLCIVFLHQNSKKKLNGLASESSTIPNWKDLLHLRAEARLERLTVSLRTVHFWVRQDWSKQQATFSNNKNIVGHNIIIDSIYRTINFKGTQSFYSKKETSSMTRNNLACPKTMGRDVCYSVWYFFHLHFGLYTMKVNRYTPTANQVP